MKKVKKSVGFIYGITLIIYAVLFFLIPFKKNETSWFSFGFTVFGFVFGFFVFLYAFSKAETLMSKLYGFPIFKIGYVYTVIQFVVGVLFCLTSVFVAIPMWICIVIYIALFGVTLIGLIITDNARDLIENMDTQTAKKTQVFESIKINLFGVLELCEDKELKTSLEKLYEKFKYSDPVSCAETEELEEKLLTSIFDLKQFVQDNKKDDCLKEIKIIEIQLSERNRLCKAFKKNI